MQSDFCEEKKKIPVVPSTKKDNEQIQADWNQLDDSQVDHITNKPFQMIGSGLTVTDEGALTYETAEFIQSTHIRVVMTPHNNLFTISLYTPYTKFASENMYARIMAKIPILINEWREIPGSRIEAVLPLDSLDLSGGLTVAFHAMINGTERCFGTFNSITTRKDWLADDQVLGIYHRPFKTIGDGLQVENDELQATWKDLLDRPFTKIGEGLFVVEGTLVARPKTLTINEHSEKIEPDMYGSCSVTLRIADGYATTGRANFTDIKIANEKLGKPYRIKFPTAQLPYHFTATMNTIPQGFIDIEEENGTKTPATARFRVSYTAADGLILELFSCIRAHHNISNNRDVLHASYNAASYGIVKSVHLRGGSQLFFVDGMQLL